MPPSSKAVQQILDISKRRYRAAFAVTTALDSDDERRALFKGYGALDNLKADQRVGACLITGDQLHDWFDELAGRSVTYLNDLKGGVGV